MSDVRRTPDRQYEAFRARHPLTQAARRKRIHWRVVLTVVVIVDTIMLVLATVGLLK